MYQFKVNDEIIGYSATPLYIKKLDNGNYTICNYEEAEGVSIHGTAYSLEGKYLDNLPVITFEEVNDIKFSNSVVQTSDTAIELAERVVDLELALLEV